MVVLMSYQTLTCLPPIGEFCGGASRTRKTRPNRVVHSARLSISVEPSAKIRTSRSLHSSAVPRPTEPITKPALAASSPLTMTAVVVNHSSRAVACSLSRFLDTPRADDTRTVVMERPAPVPV
jgi:hypothetical protein